MCWVPPNLYPTEAFLRDVLGRTWKGNECKTSSFLEESVISGEAGILNVAEVLTSPTPRVQNADAEIACCGRS